MANAHAEIYKCKEPGGEVRFSDAPCPNVPNEVVDIRTGETRPKDAPPPEPPKPEGPVDPFASVAAVAEGSAQFAGRTMPIRSALAEVFTNSGRVLIYLYPFEMSKADTDEVIKSGDSAALRARKPSPSVQYWKQPPWLWLTLKFDPAKPPPYTAADLKDARLEFMGFAGNNSRTRVTQTDVDLKSHFQVLDIAGLEPGKEVHLQMGSVDNGKFLYRIKVKARTFVFKADAL